MPGSAGVGRLTNFMVQHEPERVLRPADVSVVVIAFNEEKRIANCIRSLSNLTVRPGEIVFVDNDSTDRTATLTADLATTIPVPSKIIHERSRGIPSARNAGIRATAGAIVAFLDADCEAPPDFVRIMIDGLNDTDAVAIAGRYVVHGEDEVMASYRERSWAETFGWTREARELMQEPEGYVGMVLGGCGIFRKDALEAVGLFDAAFPYCDDIAISLKLYQRGHRILRDPELWVHHYIDTDPRAIRTKDLRYCRDGARILKRLEGKRVNLDLNAYRAIAAHLLAYQSTRDPYNLFEARRRVAMKLATAWEGLKQGCLFV